MPTLTIEYSTDAERLALEQAIAFFNQMRRVADTAPDGTVLAACERVALDDGRRLLNDTLAAALQARADATDAKKNARRTRQRATRPLADDRRRPYPSVPHLPHRDCDRVPRR